MLKWFGDMTIANLAGWNANRCLRDHGAEFSRAEWAATAGEASQSDQHALWTTCLQRHTSHATIRNVETAVLDYNAIHSDPQFAEYLTQLAHMKTPSNPAEHLAFLLNTYNALCVKVVARAVAAGTLAGDTASIRNLGHRFTPIWKQHVGVLNGEPVSLDDIEHGHVRSIFKDARAHACLNCASVSCPDLPTAAFEARTLDTTMDSRVSGWLKNTTKGLKLNADDDGGGVIRLSMIFRWFEKDFLAELPLNSTIHLWLRQHGALAIADSLRIEYAPYDWGLNSKAVD